MKIRFWVFLTVILASCGCRNSESLDVAVESAAIETVPVVDVALDQLLLPKCAGEFPWDLGVATVTESSRIRLDQLLPKKNRIWGAAIAYDSGRAVLTYMDKTNRGEYDTFAVSCDLQNGRVLNHFPVEEMLAPFCIHPDGKQAIFCRKDGVLSQRETLYLADNVSGSGKIEFERWQPLVDPDNENQKSYDKETEIIWVEFVGRHIVTLNNTGKLHIWNRFDLSRVAMVDGVVGMPSLTPDKTRIVFLTGDMIAILDPSVPGITKTHRIGGLPNDPVISIQASGKTIAIGGQGQALLIRTDNMKVFPAMIDRLSTKPGMDLKSRFCWIGNYLCTGKDLYNFDSPIPVWKIEAPLWQTVVDGQMWAVVQESSSQLRAQGNYERGQRLPLYLRSFKIPTRKISQHIKELYETSDVVALRKGDAVSIDVSNLPMEQQQTTRASLETVLEKNGYSVSGRAEVKLVATLDEPFRTDVTYSEWMSAGREFTFDYEIQKAKLEFVKGDDVLWKSTKYVVPPSSLAADLLPESRFVDYWGGPDFSLYRETRMPAFLLGKGKFNSRGKTVLRPAGTQTYSPFN